MRKYPNQSAFLPKTEIYPMNNLIKEQIIKIQKSGATNMFDLPTVQRIAYKKGYYELVDYLILHRDSYVKFILYGEFEK